MKCIIYIVCIFTVSAFMAGNSLASSSQDGSSPHCLQLLMQEDERAHKKKKDGDFRGALEDLREAVERGNRFASASLCMFHLSANIPKDILNYKESFNECQKRAEGGSMVEQEALARFYYFGLGVNKDLREAMYWYQQSAEQGLMESQFMLGLAYMKGDGVPRDYVTSYKWLNLASGAGHKKARKLLDALSKELPLNSISEAQRLTRLWKPRKSNEVWLPEENRSCLSGDIPPKK